MNWTLLRNLHEVRCRVLDAAQIGGPSSEEHRLILFLQDKYCLFFSQGKYYYLTKLGCRVTDSESLFYNLT